MSFRQAVSTCLHQFANFDGRARRAEFWWFYLFMQIVGFVAVGVPYLIFVIALFAASANLDKNQNVQFGGGMIAALVLMGIGFIASLVLYIPFLAVSARRLHDTGQTGHWLWLHLAGLGIVPLIMCIMEGQPHPNQWGPDPKAHERWNPAAAPYGQPPQQPYAQPAQPYGQPPAPPTYAQPPAPPGAMNPQPPATDDPFSTPPSS